MCPPAGGGGGLVKRLTLFLDKIFDTVEDFPLLRAVPDLGEGLSGLKKEGLGRLLHVTTFPPLRAGEVRPEILRIGLGPVGGHVIGQDILEETVPKDIYWGVPEDFDVEEPWMASWGPAANSVALGVG